MTTVVKKRTQTTSRIELTRALEHFIDLLKKQEEDEAAEALTEALNLLRKEDTSVLKTALNLIDDAFEGDHELDAYTFPRKVTGDSWTEADALYLASTGVKSLANRIKKALTLKNS
jgi:hypothetical protein